MSFWSTIANYGKDALTGKGKAGTIAQIGGSIAGGIAAGREAGRKQENAQRIGQDDQRLQGSRDYESALMDRSKLDLAQRQFQQESIDRAYNNALRSALALNLKDVTIGGDFSGIPIMEFKGGLRPSAMGGDARAAAEMMNARALVSLMDGEQFDELPALERFTPQEMAQGNFLDTALGAIGTAGRASEAAESDSFYKRLLAQQQELLNQPQPQQPAAAKAAPTGITAELLRQYGIGIGDIDPLTGRARG